MPMSPAKAPPSINAPRPAPAEPLLRFSMFRLMGAFTLIAVLLGLIVTFDGFVNLVVISVVGCVLPTPLAICAIFGRGDVRAFAIGALIPWFTQLALRFPAPASMVWLMVWFLVMGGTCGALAVATRRRLERNVTRG